MATWNNYNNGYGTGGSGQYGQQQYGQPRIPGARREKVKGYLRAANELRQSYQTSLERKLQGEEESMPGGFPDVEIVRSGDEEMMLFPSYARKHVKRKTGEDDWGRERVGVGVPGSRDGIEHGPQGQESELVSSGDADYWKREWERYEDANAVVDVDVRGWIYSPQKGPLNRKNRLLVAVARRLSGIPAPTQQDEGSAASRDSSPYSAARRKGQEPIPGGEVSKHEEMAAAKEAENIAKRGQKEADAAMRGSYSTNSAGIGAIGGTDSATTSRSTSPVGLRRQRTGNSTDSEFATDEEDPGIRALSKRSSWNLPANMSREEHVRANELLMMRLRPFMTLPLANTTITVFFFNEKKSSSKSVTTNESGHFNVRAALDFVPTQVRVLASEKLSATEDVIITEPQGISLISDIDDTIKHSAIASGAREIFKNTFIRDLGDLTIRGVKEWYTKLASMGVEMHYVSNSPWQLYPLLKSYFSLAGLPHGSFHLKQYSGMLQGIFEPAAERKKGSLDRIMSDFPDRKFILVGDSGEADLEVYTDVVMSHPGRVLAVFIRDVTTPLKKGFFDQSISTSQLDQVPSFRDSDWSRQTGDDSDSVAKRPALPARPKTDFGKSEVLRQGDLIDFSDEPETASLHETKMTSYSDDLRQLDEKRQHGSHGHPPSIPTKPSSLRNYTTLSPTTTNHERPGGADSKAQSGDAKGLKPPPPPRPRRSSQSVDLSHTSSPSADARTPFSSFAQNKGSSDEVDPKATTSSSRPQHPSRANTSSSFRSTNQDDGYVAAARRQLNTAYNALPALRSSSPGRSEHLNADGSTPPIPPRRGLAAYPAAAARWATGATGGDHGAGGDGGAPGALYNKKEEIWKRRWARAEEIMRSKGVLLRSWREGGDVMGECVRIVEKAQRDLDGPRRGAVDGGDGRGRKR